MVAQEKKARMCRALLYVSNIVGPLRTPRRAAARIALHARAVAHQREVAALAAGLALVALGAGFGALLARRGFRVLLGVHRVDAELELPGRRQLRLGLGLERGGGAGVERGHLQRSAGRSLRRGDASGAARRNALHHLEPVGARARQALRDEARGRRRLAFRLALAERVEAALARVDMREVEALEIRHRQLAEHV